MPTIEDLSRDRLSAFLTQHGDYRKEAGEKGTTQGVDCPEHVARFILNQWDLSGYPVLRGLINAAQYTEEGRLIREKGYDKASGLLHVSDFDVEPVPQTPSDAEVAKAVAEYVHVFGDFPFEGMTREALERGAESADFANRCCQMNRLGSASTALPLGLPGTRST